MRFFRVDHIPLLILSSLILLFFSSISSYAQTSGGNEAPSLMQGSSNGNASGGTVVPDLFTGTMSYTIPIEVPPGRKGMDPGLALTYRSSNGNGVEGVGWELEVGAIERSTRFGVNYNGDDYIFRMAGATVDLVNFGGNDYRAKIEGAFRRVRKLTATDNQPYWEVTDKTGTRYLFGQSTATRQTFLDGSTSQYVTFKWCLERVEDPNGNSMTFSYRYDQGQIYPDRIDYTGHVSGLTPTNYVKFDYETTRTDAPHMYTPNFDVRTAYRLKTISVFANGQYPSGTLVRKYVLEYDTDPTTTGAQYSSSTGRSLLTQVTQYDSNGTQSLPPTKFSYTGMQKRFDSSIRVSEAQRTTVGHRWVADVNGDGRKDIVYRYNRDYRVFLSNGRGFNPDTSVWGTATYDAEVGREWLVDVDGDGLADIVYQYGTKYHVLFSTGQGFGADLEMGTVSLVTAVGYTWPADVNGDGQMDMVYRYDNNYHVLISLPNRGGFDSDQIWGSAHAGAENGREWLMDVNGDGMADVVYHYGNRYYVMLSNGKILPSTGKGFQDPTWSCGALTYTVPVGYEWPADVNGDGKMDMVYRNSTDYYVSLSFGSQFLCDTFWGKANHVGVGEHNDRPADVNGDGKMDMVYTIVYQVYVVLSSGESFVTDDLWSTNGHLGSDQQQWLADIDGDGKADVVHNLNGDYTVLFNTDPFPDLLSSVTSSLGGSTTITYKPSTQNTTNKCLPFAVQTVSSITADNMNTNNRVVTTANYDYLGGCYYIPERDFRGFNYVKTTVDPAGQPMVTETWFHQGNDTAVNFTAPDFTVDTPNVAGGYMKGKPYRVKVTDAGGNTYSEVLTSYATDSLGSSTTAPYFNPRYRVDASIYDGDTSAKTTRVYYTYDCQLRSPCYGNLEREDQYGDADPNVTSDDRTITRSFLPNDPAWIVGFPISEIIYQGIGTTNQVARTDFYYDGVSDCNTPSNNQMPTQGHVTLVVRWLNGGTSPKTRMAYDAYGNLTCTRDDNGNTTTISYDGSHTFPRFVTNPFYHTVTTQYYGVDGVAVDKGLYGQVKSVTDPNGNAISTEYDSFGRVTLTTGPPDDTNIYGQTSLYGKTTKCYLDLGNPSLQRILTYTLDQSAALPACGSLAAQKYPWMEDSFDGLGRTYKTRRQGPSGNIIRVDTVYNSRGQVSQTSLPYFDGNGTARYKTFTYDPVGRVKQVDNPDNTSTFGCFNDWVTVGIDANGHRKRETRDAYGRLIQVDEYLGTFSPPCNTNAGTPYATTHYEYDVLGNLLSVTDAKGNKTTMQYDSLSRKVFMHDPDMGDWTYQYDGGGNLIKQTDPKGQTIIFTYDALNRLVQKIFR